ncbi:23S rRNA pseudouridine2457 synthase [Herbaspirillum sp. Sphag1AN]|uniref:pseudouridine synthase n=1 Tax=unclassified Herbaspirillum TaxID=2624150 RepID=UPI00160F9E7C|nr:MULTISPECIES: pseudouridine synthase [unclassified Herbaspirillum]MBB3211183.1 23S rRNA pseudouridine2457 synthase [Herbaspirillum sp. Sphag1AN]MBB3244812.1 23S rRNA pseudouridine2457 synthase [Herbaspirillum sp. Sphag64]
MPLILFNKPFQVLCQFSPDQTDLERETLSDYLRIPDIYPAGRLDADSEGLMLLTNDGKLQHAISHPEYKQSKTYLVQVEGTPDANALAHLRQPLDLGDFITQGSQVSQVQEPAWLWPRNPPIRQRKNQATSWLIITISEGKNRQVRRMTAAVGLPTLRLVRIAIGPYALHTDPLFPGEWKTVDPSALTEKH